MIAIDDLKVVPFLDSGEKLEGELPSYIAKSNGVSDKLAWWKSGCKENQASALEDNTETSTMLHYNSV